MERIDKKQWLSLRDPYRRDGLAIARAVIDNDLVGEGRQHIDWLMKRYPDLRPEQLHNNLMTKDAFWVRLISDERLLDVVEAFIGPNIALFASHYIAKPPYTGEAVLWHQDGSFWPLQPMEVISLWLSFDEVTPANGCMRLIPGTQHLDLQKIYPRMDVKNVLNASMDEGLVDESSSSQCRSGAWRPFHSSSECNPWFQPQYITKLATGADHPLHPYLDENHHENDQVWPSAFLLRGEAVPGVNQYQPRPAYQPSESMPFRGCENWK